MYGKFTSPRAAGVIITADDAGQIIERETLQCVHCGSHWPIQPGSGKIRGFCGDCKGPICGPQCAECVPYEQRLENLEAGRPLDFRPVRVPIRLPSSLGVSADQ